MKTMLLLTAMLVFAGMCLSVWHRQLWTTVALAGWLITLGQLYEART